MNLRELLPSHWQIVLADVLPLLDDIEARIAGSDINPVKEKIFAAFDVEPSRVKVVIIGQDPYPQLNHATGLAFSIPVDVSPWPPTLKNILKEYSDDLGYELPTHGDLTAWRDQGVLMLNPILTCKSGESLSHKGVGWELFTSVVIEKLAARNVLGILWGREAAKYQHLFNPGFTITSPHPSPLSSYRGFFGSRPFSRTNEILIGAGQSPIDWKL